jgi:ATP-dependent DNA helicase RecG
MVKKPPLKLETNIRYVKGVGPKMANRLAKLEIKTVADLISHYPFRHEDYSQITPIELAQPGKKVTLIGQIKEITSAYTRSRKQRTIQRAILEDETGQINLIWFNQPYLKANLQPPKLVSVSGKINRRNNQLQIIYPEYEILNNKKEIFENSISTNSTKDTGRLVPVYPTTQGISSKYLRKIISRVLPKIKNQIIENLPPETLTNNQLISKQKAILNIHFPENKKALLQAQYRLAFEELLTIHLKKLINKQNWKKQKKSPILPLKNNILKKFLETLPFKLTEAQKKAVSEITGDINKKQAMNRLLQGDVGSGKTVVAASAVLQTVKNNYQAVLMAPTEILAQQHYQNLSKMLQPFQVSCQLLTSSHKPTNRSSPFELVGLWLLVNN